MQNTWDLVPVACGACEAGPEPSLAAMSNVRGTWERQRAARMGLREYELLCYRMAWGAAWEAATNM